MAQSPPTDREFFERFYEKEDPWSIRTIRRERDKIPRILEAFRNTHFRTGLDIGCGEGELLSHLTFVDEWTGVDVSERALERARRRFPHIRFVQADLATLNLPAQYDFISCLECLYYLSDREDAVRRIAALGAPGGVFLFSVVTNGDESLRHYFSLPEAIELLSRHFTIKEYFALSLPGGRIVNRLPAALRLARLRRARPEHAYQCAFVCVRR